MKLKNLPILLPFLLLLLFNTNIKAQQTGYLHLRIYGSKTPAVCMLDGARIATNDSTFSLASGKHSLKIWMPKMKLIDSTIVIPQNNDTAKYSFLLRFRPEYVAYRKAYADYTDTRNKRFFVSPIFMGLTIGTGLFINNKYGKKQYAKMEDHYATYNGVSTQAEMNVQKDEFYAAKKKYERLKKVEYGIYSVAGVLALNYVRIIIKQRRTPVPHYTEEKLFSRIDFNLYPDIDRKALICGLSLKF